MADSKATKITKLVAEGFKRLRAVEITPQGNVIQIRGKNAAGKSSVLDAIQAALGGKRRSPTKPVREGAAVARIVTELDDGLVVTRTFTPDGGGTLTIETAEGARLKSPQAILDKLFGAAALDPLAFVRLDADERLERIRELAGVDVAPLEGKRARAYDSRTEVNRDVRRLEAQLAGVPRVEGAPEQPVDVGALADELRAAQLAHAEFDKLEFEMNATARRIRSDRDLLRSTMEEVARLQSRIAELERTIQSAESELDAKGQASKAAKPLLPDCVAIRERLGKAEEVNAGVRRNKERDRILIELQAASEQSDELTSDIERLDREKVAAISGAKLPVEGLSWTDEGVTLNGIPFEQASSAEQLRTSVGLAIAAHPQLRVLLVREGSLLDADGLELLAAIAAEHDCQIWLEVVSDDAGGGVLIEDGTVRAATSAPADGQLALGEG